MNATISIGISDNGRVDVLIHHHDKREYFPLTKVSVTKTRAYNNITGASFIRIAKIISHGMKTHETQTLIHYRVKSTK